MKIQKEKLEFKSEVEMQKELQERLDSWKQGQGRDGYILVAEGEFEYRGIIYFIKIMRYYSHTNKFTTVGRGRTSEYHAVVEHPDETNKIIDLIPNYFESEFLYHDTLHSWNDKETTEEQIETCHKLAKQDIDNLFDGEISKRIDEGIKRLEEAKKKLNQGIKKLK